MRGWEKIDDGLTWEFLTHEHLIEAHLLSGIHLHAYARQQDTRGTRYWARIQLSADTHTLLLDLLGDPREINP
jgi:hypothetical protein